MKMGTETPEASRVTNPTQTDRGEFATVLIVDDEESALRLCADIATEAGLRVRTATTTEKALETLDEYPIDIVITDLRIPELGGLELLHRIREHYPEVAVLVLTQYGTIQTAVEATRLGATDYVTKPFTGILGNAELLLSQLHDKLPPLSVQRLQTVVDLAVRLREKVRRFASEPRNHESSVRSA